MIAGRVTPSLIFCLLLTSCGGAPSQDSNSPKSSSNRAPDHNDQWSEASNEEAQDEVPRAPDCSDGTCFQCGDGICPQGAYCDEGAQGGAACAWLSECKASPSCACIKKALGGACSCNDAEGGPVVSCE